MSILDYMLIAGTTLATGWNVSKKRMERPKCCGLTEQLKDLLCKGQFGEEKAWKELPCLASIHELQTPRFMVLLPLHFLPERSAKRNRKGPLYQFCENLNFLGNFQKSGLKGALECRCSGAGIQVSCNGMTSYHASEHWLPVTNVR